MPYPFKMSSPHLRYDVIKVYKGRVDLPSLALITRCTAHELLLKYLDRASISRTRVSTWLPLLQGSPATGISKSGRYQR